MDSLVIRQGTPEDAADIAGLMTELGYPSTGEAMRRRLAILAERSDHVTLVAIDGGQTVGVIGAALWPGYHDDRPTGWIISLVVSEASRGRRVGARLVKAAEDWMRAGGAGKVAVTSHRRRDRAHAFYRGLGYEENGVRFVRPLDGGDAATPPPPPRTG